MRKVLVALFVLALAFALAQRYFTEEELKRIETGGKAYAEVFVAKGPTRPSAPSTGTASPPTSSPSSWKSSAS